MKINLKTNEILTDFSSTKIERHYKSSENNKNPEEKIDLSKWNINKEQENILRYISIFLEEGKGLHEVIENVANILDIDREEVLEQIENIKEQNDKNKIRSGEK